MGEGKIAVITGAAKGIGRKITLKLIEDNFFAIAIDIDKNADIEQLNRTSNGNFKYYICDISKETEVLNLFKIIVEKYPSVDVLVNNAGIIKDNLIHKMSLDDFENVINVNLKGTWLMCREVAKIMREQKFGRIINISSRAWLGNPGQSNYSASKAGIIALTRVLALELGKYNVMVNAIAPGLIDTPLTQSLPREIFEKLINTQPTKTIGKPEDVANVVSFLANEKTQFITGQTIYIDGGKSIGANF